MNKKLQRQVKVITDRIIQGYQPKKIVLFGSATGGRFGQDSDLDLAIIKKTDKRFYDRIGDVLDVLYSHQWSPDLPLDLLVYTPQEFQRMEKKNPFVKEEIVARGITLYEQ